MQVNSVSQAQSFKGMPIDARIIGALDDNQLKSIAYQKARHDVSDDKHRRIDNMLYYSIPLSAAFAAAVNPSNMSRISRLSGGAKLAAILTLPFAAVHGAFAVKDQIDKHSRTSAMFSANHPILTGIGTFTAGLLAAGGVRAGAEWLTEKLGVNVDVNGKKATETIAKKLDESKVLNFASKQLAKWPAALKEFSKSALRWSPYVIAAVQIGHVLNHENVKTREYYKNLDALRTVRTAVRNS